MQLRCQGAKKHKTTTAMSLMTAFLMLNFGTGEASALTYQNNVNVNFTFNSSLALSLSPSDIIISEIIPGNTADSNTITVNVATNSKAGYTLTSTVGDTAYNTRDMVHQDPNSNAAFTSVDFGQEDSTCGPACITYPNGWCYYSYTPTAANTNTPDDNFTRHDCAGLPLYSDTTNVATLRTGSGPSADNGDNVKFRIAAKADSTQPAGEYKNVVNFILVAEPEPMTLAESYAAAGKSQINGYYRLQDMTPEICDNTEVLDDDSQLQLLDTRDNKIYWATKLQDGHCWMTQNLDLDLDSTITYTHANTDLGWGSDTATTSWTPDKSTIVWNGSTFSGWSNQNAQQYSADPGDYYYAGYDGTTLLPSAVTNYLTITPDSNGDIIKSSNSNVYFSTNPSRVNGGTHEHVGNYYNWSAAVASNDTSSYASSTYADVSGNPQNSICPAGWRLPTITSAAPTYANAGSKNEFTRLANLYASYVGSTSISSAGLEAAPLFFARGGYVNGASLYTSGYGAYYWSSSVYSSSGAYYLYFDATNVYPQGSNYRDLGRSVRCLAR